MKIFILTLQLLALLFNFSRATAYPGSHEHDERDNGCLTVQETNTIINKYISLFTKFNETVSNNTLAVDFHLISDSTNSATPGATRGKAIASSRAEFNAQQLAAQAGPAIISGGSITALNIVHGCEKIAFRWEFNATFALNGPIMTPEFSSTDKKGDKLYYRGIELLVLKKGTRLIQTSYSEADVISFLFDLGVYVCFQNKNQTHCAP